jgi:CRISPR-associated protein Csy3
MTASNKLPGVLAYQRGMITTDCLFFNRYDNGTLSPLPVTRHGIRGTQNINKITEGSEDGASAASATRESPSNIQTTDSAKLDPNAVALEVRFDLRFVDIKQLLFSCAPGKKDSQDIVQKLRTSFNNFVDRAKSGDAIRSLACRYARNIANGRFLWRNRMLAEKVTVEVYSGSQLIASFNALSIPLDTFEEYLPDEEKVAEVIEQGLKDGNRNAKLSIRAIVDFGVRGAVEVFPSQNYLEGKEKGFARPLYCVGFERMDQDKHSVKVMGQAAFRDQKISNALRTIDTWYPAYSDRRVPIPVEPNGASLDAQEFFRNTSASSGFKLMLKMNELDPSSPDGQFLLACIIRGGVFSGSDTK